MINKYTYKIYFFGFRNYKYYKIIDNLGISYVKIIKNINLKDILKSQINMCDFLDILNKNHKYLKNFNINNIMLKINCNSIFNSYVDNYNIENIDENITLEYYITNIKEKINNLYINEKYFNYNDIINFGYYNVFCYAYFFYDLYIITEIEEYYFICLDIINIMNNNFNNYKYNIKDDVKINKLYFQNDNIYEQIKILLVSYIIYNNDINKYVIDNDIIDVMSNIKNIKNIINDINKEKTTPIIDINKIFKLIHKENSLDNTILRDMDEPDDKKNLNDTKKNLNFLHNKNDRTIYIDEHNPNDLSSFYLQSYKYKNFRNVNDIKQNENINSQNIGLYIKIYELYQKYVNFNPIMKLELLELIKCTK